MARYTGRFGLHGLGAAYLEAFGGGIGVERHVLRLEGGGPVAVLAEDAAEGGGNDTLTYVAARTGQHEGMKFLHISFKLTPAKVQNFMQNSNWEG